MDILTEKATQAYIKKMLPKLTGKTFEDFVAEVKQQTIYVVVSHNHRWEITDLETVQKIKTGDIDRSLQLKQIFKNKEFFWGYDPRDFYLHSFHLTEEEAIKELADFLNTEGLNLHNVETANKYKIKLDKDKLKEYQEGIIAKYENAVISHEEGIRRSKDFLVQLKNIFEEAEAII